MTKETITKREIDELYRRVNVQNPGATPSSRLNLGTMNNKLSNGAKGLTRLKAYKSGDFVENEK